VTKKLTPWFAAPLLALALTHPVSAQPAGSEDAGESRIVSELSFDPMAATRAYLDRVPADDSERSASYFEGGYWLQLWSFLYGLGVAWLLLSRRISARIRDRVESWTRRAPLRSALYAAIYVPLSALLTFPLAIYSDFFREHSYGLSNQSLGEWLRDQLVGLAVAVVLVTLLVTALYATIRRSPRGWWVWSTVVVVVFFAFVSLIGPVFIAPLFNDYQAIEDPAVADPILRMARGNGIPAEHVYEFDASRQSKRISANVSGLLGTMRISLNDNLLERCTQAEIEAVMGHEMGHYVLNHIYKGILFFGLVFACGFAFVSRSFDWARGRWGESWGVRGAGDVAGLPLMVALLSVWLFALTPLLNTWVRSAEAEADIFGINASGQPEGFAEVALKLGEYRKLAPGPVEEWIFFDHPSGRARIEMAMRWRAAHPTTLPGATSDATREADRPPAASP